MSRTLKEILESRDKSRRTYYDVETFVLRLIEEHLRESGKRLSTSDDISKVASRYLEKVDGIAPDGLDNLPGPTLIEIKLAREPSFLLKIWPRLAELASRMECSSVLLVLAGNVPQPIRNKLHERWTSKIPNVPLEIWGLDKLENIINQHRSTLGPMLENLTTFRLRFAVEKSVSDWRKERDSRLMEISSEYNAANLALVLGAGVSIDAGLPDWATLLDSLFVRLLTRELAVGSDIRDDEIASIVKRLKTVDDPSPLMTARYLRKGLSGHIAKESDEFHTAVSNVLYGNGKRRVHSNSWVKALAKMIHPRRTGAKIRAVVTYNFDDLLEKELSASGDLYRSIFREGDYTSNEEIPIYHVHGFLPETHEDYDSLDESTLVFSEEGYHEIYVDAYHWTNLVQLNLLRESTCLFIGLSLTDPNLRRLLEISARRSGNYRHFAFMQRMNEEEFTTIKGKRVVKARKKSTEQFIASHHKIKEELFRELGLTIIWFDDFKEVPKLLSRIQSNI